MGDWNVTRDQARLLALYVTAELATFRTVRDGNRKNAWAALERAHILSQPLLWPHLRVHAAMLAFGLRCGDLREVFGQLARLTLAPLGAVTGRLPWGNSGRARVSAFASAPVAPALARRLHEAGVTQVRAQR